MANYCSNSIVFYSKSKELLTDLWNKMDSCIDDGDNNIKKLLKGCGCTQEEADEWADGRDYLVYLDDKVHDDDGLYYFRAIQKVPGHLILIVLLFCLRRNIMTK